MIIGFKAITDFINISSTDYMQLGLIIDSGIDFRYPAQNMTETLNCNKETYDPLVSKSYLNKLSNNITIVHECNLLVISLSFPEGVFSLYLSSLVFSNLLVSDISYTLDSQYYFFISSSDFSYSIVSSGVLDDKDTCSSVFQGDRRLIDECKRLNTSITDTTNVTLQGYNSWIYGSYTPVVLNPKVVAYSVLQSNSFVAGVFVTKRIVLQNWGNLIDCISDIINAQIVVYALFMLLAVGISLRLSYSVIHKIIYPISVIEKILKKQSNIQETQVNYNRQFNKLIKYLKLLEIYEKIIDPRFFMHPDIDTRIDNLSKANELFKEINNYRGQAIIQNLIGNAYFSQNSFSLAESCYKSSLDHVIKLLKLVETQQKNQNNFKSPEKMLVERFLRTWNEEIIFLKENITERKQQICMAIEAQIEVSINESINKSKLKEINKLYQEILEHYLSTRTHYIRLIKVLINISKVFQYLQYYHSGLQLLSIVKEELLKIRNDQISEIDIDITRLRSTGIHISIDETIIHNKHFYLENVVFEKDILMQHVYYRQGMILLKNDKPQEAAQALTSAIVTSTQEFGHYYDPSIRAQAADALHKMMTDFQQIINTKDLQEIYRSIHSAKKSIIFTLIYSIKFNTDINLSILNFIRNKINKVETKIGVIIEDMYGIEKLDPVQRDAPDIDLENLFINTNENTSWVCIYDTLLRAVYEFPNDYTEKIVVAVIYETRDVVGAATADNLNAFMKKGIKLIVICDRKVLPSEFITFIMTNKVPTIYIDSYSSLEKSLEELESILNSP